MSQEQLTLRMIADSCGVHVKILVSVSKLYLFILIFLNEQNSTGMYYSEHIILFSVYTPAIYVEIT